MSQSNETVIAFGSAIKSLGNGRVGGRLVAFTNAARKDLSGEYFDASTDFGRTPTVGTMALYHHALDPVVGDEEIGTVDTIKFDEEGIWVEAQLNLHSKYARRVQQLVDKGVLSWSSGALPQTRRVDTDGHIRKWHIFEASLTPTPAEPFGTQISPIKSLHIASLKELLAIEDLDADGESMEHEARQSTSTLEEGNMSNVTEIVEAVVAEVGEMGGEEVLNLVSVVEAAVNGEDVAMVNDAAPEDLAMEDPYDEEKATEVQKAVARIAQAAAKAAKHQKSKVSAKSFGGVAKSAVSAENPYANGIKNAAAQGGNGENMSAKNAPWASNGAPAVIEDLAAKARWANYSARQLSAIAGITAMMNEASPASKRVTLSGMSALYQTAAAHALEETQHRSIALTYPEAQKASAIKSMKANELDHTTQSGYGSDFINTLWLNQLVEDARRENVVAPLFDSFQMGAKIVTEPVQGGRGTVYFVGESTADTHQAVATSLIPDSKVGTDNRTFTAKKLATRIGWSAELEEDSIIRFSQYVQTSASENLARSIDHVILMGDNEAGTTNINYDGGTPNGDEEWMIFDGVGVNGLANGVDGLGDAITYSDFLATRFKLNREASGALDKIVFFISPELEHYFLAMPEFTTLDKFGPGAAILTGQIGRFGGIPVVVTPVIQLAASDGKITYNAAGTLSRGIMVYRPGWKIGYRRAPEPYMYRAPDGESWQLTLTTRLDLQNNQQTGIASMLYNVLG
jgi:HK97 family phage major capsid protein